jgi:2-polyprenyl-3-methyl-5-hydroxy-6-metoxy-1,4-benzoquinol methylase
MRGLKQINAEEWQRRQEGIEQRYKLRNRFKIAYDRLCAHSPKRWIDIGAGNGFLAEVVKPALPGVHVVGVDFVEEIINGATALDERIVHDLDEADLPFESARFDFVTCLDTLEHVVLPERFMQEMFRILCPGGRCLISVPNMQFIEYVLSFAKGKVPHPAADPRHMSVFTLPFLSQKLQGVGFQITYTAGCDASPMWLARISKRYLCKTIVVEGVKPYGL